MMPTYEKADRGRVAHKTNPRALELEHDVIEAVKMLRKAIRKADALDDAKQRARRQGPQARREVELRWEKGRAKLAKARAELDAVLLGDDADAEDLAEPAESLEVTS